MPFAVHLYSGQTIFDGFRVFFTEWMDNPKIPQPRKDTAALIKESIENQRDKPFNLVTYDQTLHETMAAYTTKQMVKVARVGGRIRR